MESANEKGQFEALSKLLVRGQALGGNGIIAVVFSRQLLGSTIVEFTVHGTAVWADWAG